jgi:peptidyl-prolyl cis-trans isomerase D
MAKNTSNPAPQQDDDTPRKRRGSVLGYILLGLIAVSMLSFGVTSFGGGTSRVGTVGDQVITADDYANALQAEANRFTQMIGTPLPMRDLIAAGLDRQVLADLIRRAALDNEAGRVGLSVGDAEVAAELVKIAAFTGLDGTFDRAAYGETLRRNNLSEAQFEADLRADIARGLMQSALIGGTKAPSALSDTLLAYDGETRDISWIALTEADLPVPLTAPTDAQLRAEYDANIADYTRPEAKRISYIALLPSDLAPDMPADEAQIAALYQERIDQYVIPEKRLVERLVYPSEAEAQAARAKLDAGASFEDLVAERGLTLADIDLGDVEMRDLGAAGEAVFALTEPGVAGPLQSDLGPALFRMNAILAAQETTLDQARPDLAREVQTSAAVAAIADRIDAIDDALAGGATLAELAQSEGIEVSQTDYAATAPDNDPIASYSAFRKAADALAIGDFPEAIILEDGGVVALEMIEVVAPTPRPFDNVADQVRDALRGKMLTEALAAVAQTKLEQALAGTAFADLGAVQTSAGTVRGASLPSAPQELVTAAFAAPLSTAQIVQSDGFIGLMLVDKITPADANPQASDLESTLNNELGQSIAGDIFDLFGRQIETAAGITVDQAVISSIHTQMGN